MGWMGIWWLLGAVLISVLVWALVRTGHRRLAGPAAESPEDILKRRYARGEIDQETYRQMKAELKA